MQTYVNIHFHQHLGISLTHQVPQNIEMAQALLDLWETLKGGLGSLESPIKYNEWWGGLSDLKQQPCSICPKGAMLFSLITVFGLEEIRPMGFPAHAIPQAVAQNQESLMHKEDSKSWRLIRCRVHEKGAKN